jgi:Fe-S-cluster containining protein
MVETEKPWFHQGLKFQCTGCGQCCTGSPGYVYLSPSDIEKLSEHVGVSTIEFTKRYTRFVDGGYALLDRPGSYDCIFLENKKCTAYNARPVQCRTFPWWIGNLDSPEAWEDAAKRCEGINAKDAPVIESLHIETECATYLDNILEQNF